MATMLIVLIVTLVLGVGFLLYFLSTYNRLISLRTLLDEAWSGIDVQLKRRYDLIPNLVNTVKGYSVHEKDIFEKIAEKRAASMGATSIAKKAEYEGELSQAIGRLFAIAEAYPDLKANKNFLQMQGDLTEIERELQLARRYYNGTARNYNQLVLRIPSNIVASIAGFEKVPYFEVSSSSEREAPKVNF